MEVLIEIAGDCSIAGLLAQSVAIEGVTPESLSFFE